MNDNKRIAHHKLYNSSPPLSNLFSSTYSYLANPLWNSHLLPIVQSDTTNIFHQPKTFHGRVTGNYFIFISLVVTERLLHGWASIDGAFRVRNVWPKTYGFCTEIFLIKSLSVSFCLLLPLAAVLLPPFLVNGCAIERNKNARIAQSIGVDLWAAFIQDNGFCTHDTFDLSLVLGPASGILLFLPSFARQLNVWFKKKRQDLDKQVKDLTIHILWWIYVSNNIIKMTLWLCEFGCSPEAPKLAFW